MHNQEKCMFVQQQFMYKKTKLLKFECVRLQYFVKRSSKMFLQKGKH